jgi:hypothetical protein
MDSDLGDLYMNGKLRRYNFKWLWSQAKIHEESTGKYSTSWCPEPVSVLRHCIWSFGPCILSWPTSVATRGSWPPQTPLIHSPPPSSRVGFCLVHFCQEQDAVLQLWNPIRELNQLLSVIWLLLRALTCVLRFAGKSKPSWRGQSSSS